MLISLFAIIVAVVGLLLYVLASNPKLSEIGRIMFFCGALVTTWALGGRGVRLL